MKFKKGSAEAKAFMAKLRAAKGKTKKAKVGAVKKKAAPKKTIGAVKKKAAKKKSSIRNYGSHKDTKSHNVKINVMSGVPKDKKYNVHAVIQKTNGLSESLYFFYFSKLSDAKKCFNKLIPELKERLTRGVYSIEIMNVDTLKPVKVLTWIKI